jgi:hypothetical protein
MDEEEGFPSGLLCSRQRQRLFVRALSLLCACLLPRTRPSRRRRRRLSRWRPGRGRYARGRRFSRSHEGGLEGSHLASLAS